MGLDNLWKKNDNETASVEGNFQICGGMFSGHGNDSFRGKVYHRLVEDITGISLYGYTNESDIIPNEIIKDWKQQNGEIHILKTMILKNKNSKT
jgi:hypothetical protein